MKRTLFILMSILFLSACDESKDPKQVVRELADKRVAAEKAISGRDLRFEDHVALKEYFSDVAAIATALKNNPQKKESIIKRAGLASVENTCHELLLSKEIWEELMSRCQYRGYFVCAEEVRAYKEAVMVLYSSLDSDTQERFKINQNCPIF